MDDDRLNRPRALLAGLSAQTFMARHWQRKPLLIRGAWPGVQPPVTRRELFELAGSDEVESRCVEQHGGTATRRRVEGKLDGEGSRAGSSGWRLRHGPFARRALPPLKRPGWTLLVQGLNLHVQAAHRMLREFDFIPQVRRDDLMLSYASDGGGVGPHVDSYDVFLLQVAGRRRWSIAPPDGGVFVPGLPLRILAHFEPQQEWILEPGDMLYLPPGWGHDGVALGGDCMTASIGFRAPTAAELVTALIARLGDEVAEVAAEESEGGTAGRARRSARWSDRMTDQGQPAVLEGARIPMSLQAFAAQHVERLLRDESALQRALGSWATEPHPRVWFEAREDEPPLTMPLQLDRRSRMAYDDRHLFFNGEAYRVAGHDGKLLRQLADLGVIGPSSRHQLSLDAREALVHWWQLGWINTQDG